MNKFISKYKIPFLSLLLCYILVGCQEDPYYTLGKEAVIKIEKFKQEHNRLPDNLEEIGIILKKNDRFFYEKISDQL